MNRIKYEELLIFLLPLACFWPIAAELSTHLLGSLLKCSGAVSVSAIAEKVFFFFFFLVKKSIVDTKLEGTPIISGNILQ